MITFRRKLGTIRLLINKTYYTTTQIVAKTVMPTKYDSADNSNLYSCFYVCTFVHYLSIYNIIYFKKRLPLEINGWWW